MRKTENSMCNCNCCGLGKPGSSCHISCYVTAQPCILEHWPVSYTLEKLFSYFHSCSLFSIDGLHDHEAKHMCIMCPLISMVPCSKTFSGKRLWWVTAICWVNFHSIAYIWFYNCLLHIDAIGKLLGLLLLTPWLMHMYIRYHMASCLYGNNLPL